MEQAIPVKSKQDYFIKYNPNINKHFGNNKSSVIIDRLEYWFIRAESGFYKYLEPCESAMCRAGDTWLEETGIRRKAFKAVFQLFGTWYSSKSEYLKQDDPFKGKMYLAYYDRKHNQMHFLRNHDLVNSFFQNIKTKLFNKKQTVKQRNSVSRIEYKSTNNIRSCNGTNVRSFLRVDNIYNNTKQITTSSNNQTDITDLDNGQQIILNTKIDEIDNNLVKRLKDIWLEEIGEFKDTGKTGYIAKQLVFAYNTLFDSNDQRFREYCRKIASSRFLMGEVTSFKGRVDWLLQSTTINKIQNDEYSAGDRETLYQQKQQQNKQYQQALEVIELKDQSKKMNKQGLMAKVKLFVINNWSYADYISWFKTSTIDIDSKDNTVNIKGITGFTTDYIENKYLFQINNYVKNLVHNV